MFALFYVVVYHVCRFSPPIASTMPRDTCRCVKKHYSRHISQHETASTMDVAPGYMRMSGASLKLSRMTQRSSLDLD